jgi:hypothetical protein
MQLYATMQLMQLYATILKLYATILQHFRMKLYATMELYATTPGWGDKWTEWARGGANGGAIYGGAYSQLWTVIKAFASIGHRILMELLAREQGTASQSIKLSALMLAAMVYVFISLSGPPIMHSNLIQQSKHRCAEGFALALTMPRARGRPRRGAGWYAADARKKRHQRFARAMLLAKEKHEVAPQHQIHRLEPMLKRTCP